MIKILHLEDDMRDQKLVRSRLAEEGLSCHITSAFDAPTFAAALSGDCYDVILSDYNMPSFDGLAAMKMAREKCPQTPFIVVSGAMGEVAAVDILRAGATDYILKDRLERLAGAINRAIRESRDRLARQHAEAALREAKDQAEAANRAKDRFLAVLSHELRTPLSPVLLLLSAMQNDPDLPARLRDDVLTVLRNVQLETKLIDDLLDLSRVITGKLPLDLAATEVHPLLQHVCDSSAVEFADKRISLQLELRAKHAAVEGDPARLQQVIWNLLRNALKFTPPGGSVVVSTDNPSPGVMRIQVRDSGVGIGPEVLPKIFDAFEQGDPAITLRFGGLGLGLAISKAVVDMHRGSIRAESGGLDQGACFTVELPTLPAPKAAGAPDSKTPGEVDGKPRIRVLLVEDHADTARALSRLLSVSGYAVGTAGTVEAALKLAAAEPFDVMVSDIGLPDATGFELMRLVREQFALKGIALTGFGQDDDLARSREAGFADHVVKPVDIGRLDAAIRRTVGSLRLGEKS
jgi:signal transduction histidine kinase